jgi:anti-sigma factor RsiW
MDRMVIEIAMFSGCPERCQLQALLLGHLSEAAAARVERHVERCRRCTSLLAHVTAEDSLIDALRAGARVALAPADQSAVRALLPRLHRLQITSSSSRKERLP